MTVERRSPSTPESPMAVPSNNNATYNPELYLSPDQQNLLLAALSSNKPNALKRSSMSLGRAQAPNSNGTHSQNDLQPQSEGHSTDMAINAAYVSPVQQTPGYTEFSSVGLDDSPFLDFDLEDGSFDWDNGGDQLIGNVPGTSSNSDELELHDKRKNLDDDNDEEGGGKRREGDDKLSKKPGRKPLTSEPTTVSSVTVNSGLRTLADCGFPETQGSESSCPASIPREEGETSQGSRDQSRRPRESIRVCKP